jgi:hypothetical protein
VGKQVEGVGEQGAGEGVCDGLVGELEEDVTCRPVVGVRIIFKYILQKQLRMWTGISWVGIGTSGGLL